MIILTISLLGRGTPPAYHEVLVTRNHENMPSVPRNNSPVAQRGAGAKKCWGPAPLTIVNILRVRILSFSDGAGTPEKFAPAPSGNPHLRHQEIWSVQDQAMAWHRTMCNIKDVISPALQRNTLPVSQSSEKHASCTCPVSYCLPATYNFFPRALQSLKSGNS